MDGPAQAFKDRTPEAVPIAGHLRRVIGGAVAFHAEDVGPGLEGMSDADVDAVAGDPDLRGAVVAE